VDKQFTADEAGTGIDAFSFIAWYDKDPSESDAVRLTKVNNQGL